MREFRSLCLFVFVLLVLFCEAAPALELVYPEDRTYMLDSGYLIVKGGETPPLDGVVIEINGLRSGMIDISSPEYKAVFKDMLILESEYEAGKNLIKIEGYVQGQLVSEVSADVYYQADFYAPAPEGYRPFVMHTAQKEQICAPCHNMRPTKEQFGLSSMGNPCGSCHKKKISKKYVHGPAGVFQCVVCHDSLSRPVKYGIKKKDVDLCSECHSDKLRDFRRYNFLHGPIEVGMCQVCHDSHSSDNPSQLVNSVNEVCLGCHGNLNVAFHFTQGAGAGHPVGGVPDPRSASGRELSCVSCHKPHGGVNRVFFEKNVFGMMFCQDCHKK